MVGPVWSQLKLALSEKGALPDLTEATLAALPLPKPWHTNPTQSPLLLFISIISFNLINIKFYSSPVI